MMAARKGRRGSRTVTRKYVAPVVGISPPSTGLLMRLRADDVSGANGALVPSWADISGNGLPAAAQADSTKQPVLATAALNGHSVVQFDGIDNFLSLSGTALALAQNRTALGIFIAYKYGSVITGIRTLFGLSSGTSATSTRAIVYQRDGGGLLGLGGRRLDTDSGQFISGTASTVGASEVVSACYDYTNNDAFLYKNGTQVATSSVFQTTGSTSNTASLAGTIGANLAGAAEFTNVGIAEILVYSAVDATLRTGVADYLQATYGITMADATPVATTMPLTDPAGWTRVFADDFNYTFAEGTITPNGSGNLVSGPAAATVGAKFTFYPDTWDTTHGTKVYPKTVGEPGYPGDWPPIVSKYYPSRVLSFALAPPDATAQGVMQIRQRTETIGGVPTALGAVIKPKHPNGNYMNGPYARYAFRMRVRSATIGGTDYAATNNFTTSPNLYHIHVPLSIDSNNWPQNGEFNHPDGDVNRKIKGTYHPAASTNESWSYEPTPAMSPFQWHIYETIWEPGRVRFLIDGVAWKDTTDRVPSLEMAIAVFQHEANWRQPDATGEAITDIDWIVMWDPA